MSHLGHLSWGFNYDGDGDHEGKFGSFHGEEKSKVDKDLRSWYNPGLERTVRHIMREVQQMRNAGKLRPFVEGEPIGAYIPRVLVRYTEPPDARWRRRQQELRELREANDRRLDAMKREIEQRLDKMFRSPQEKS